MLDRSTFDYQPPAPVAPDRRLGLFRLLATLARNPLECWSAEFFREPIVKVRLPFTEAVLVHEPLAIKRVLLDNAANYRKDPLQRRILASGLADGLLSVEGRRWEVQRRTLAPLFARRTVNSFAQPTLFAANSLAEKWSGLGSGAVVDVAAEMTLTTLNVLALTIFSDGIGGEFEQFRLAMNSYFRVIGKIGLFDLLGAPEWVPRLSQARLRRTMTYFAQVIDDIIETRRRRLSAGHKEAGSDDLLSLLLRAGDPSTGRSLNVDEVRSNILTFLSAGHETTANALAWSIFLLSQSPLWSARVREEVARELRGPVEGLADRLVVTRAVVDEALRLYPPIAALSRMALDADELSGVSVKAGSLVVIAPYVLHRHRRLWRMPDLFDPSRFLQGGKNEINRFAYLPFGIGPRTCIGASFALQEAMIVLAVLVNRFDFALPPGVRVWPVQRVTLRPSALPMRISLRATSS
jgi:cytochrome P450